MNCKEALHNVCYTIVYSETFNRMIRFFCCIRSAEAEMKVKSLVEKYSKVEQGSYYLHEHLTEASDELELPPIAVGLNPWKNGIHTSDVGIQTSDIFTITEKYNGDGDGDGDSLCSSESQISRDTIGESVLDQIFDTIDLNASKTIIESRSPEQTSPRSNLIRSFLQPPSTPATPTPTTSVHVPSYYPSGTVLMKPLKIPPSACLEMSSNSDTILD